MSNILYIDCISGISGDMMVGSLLDLGIKGIDINFLRKELKKINLSGYVIEQTKVKIGSIVATKFSVRVNEKQEEKNFLDIKNLIKNSKFDEGVKNLSLNIFKEIAEAEAKVHGCSPDSIHFHEVGAIDSIIDIVSCAVLYNKLDIDIVYSRKVPLGKGSVLTDHGTLPVPAPAVVEILKGVPVYGGDFDFEVTTPTGAAIIKILTNNFLDIPDMIIKNVGIGAGDIEKGTRPNILRLFYGNKSEDSKPESFLVSKEDYKKEDKINEKIYKDIYENDLFYFLDKQELVILSANIDDSSPEIIGYLIEKIFENKALDAWAETILMKKNRPAFKICALCEYKNIVNILNLLFLETTTLGVRLEEVKRFALKRELRKVQLPYGEVIIKIAKLKGKDITILPEYESCVNLAKKTGIPLKKIYQDAIFFFSSK